MEFRYNNDSSKQNKIKYSRASSFDNSTISNISYLEYLKKNQVSGQSESTDEERVCMIKYINCDNDEHKLRNQLIIDQESTCFSNSANSLGSDWKITQ